MAAKPKYNYEHVFLARQDITQAQAESIRDEMIKVIESNGAKVSRKEYWGLRNLAYKIEKNRKAHYFLMNISGDPKAVKELERQERIHDDVIRYLTVRVDELDEKPSAIMQSSNDNE